MGVGGTPVLIGPRLWWITNVLHVAPLVVRQPPAPRCARVLPPVKTGGDQFG